jgi:hypothetical protein
MSCVRRLRHAVQLVHKSHMTRARTLLCTLYYAIAAVALIATWRQNLAFTAGRQEGILQGFASFWPALLANRATISITVDLFVFALAAVVWMLLEARRLQVRFAWLYVVFGILIAISVTFPLFLAARERRLAALGAQVNPPTEPKLGLGDALALSVLGLGTLVFVVYCTLAI